MTENSAGIGTVTKAMVRERAGELAVISGRTAQAISISEWEQAKRELTVESGPESKVAVSEAAPGVESWDPVPESKGSQGQEMPCDDEDDEGRTNGERLFEEGVNEAEHDQMLQAARTYRKGED